MQDPGWASSFCRHSASPVQLCMNAPVPHRFLEFCKENGGYTGCPFPAKLDLQQGQNLLQGLSKLSPSTSGMAGPGWARRGAVLWEEVSD